MKFNNLLSYSDIYCKHEIQLVEYAEFFYICGKLERGGKNCKNQWIRCNSGNETDSLLDANDIMNMNSK